MNRSRRLLDLAIEACWLIALALVPIAFSGPDVVVLFLQPKDFVLHAAALTILALWGFDWALGGYRPQVDLGSWSAVRRWLGQNPGNWALVAAAGFGVAAAISTVLSPLPEVSLWGRDFSQLGYELYSVLSFLVLFFAIALRAHDPGQVRRILWAIVGAGVVTGLYGISQRYGWDPIGNGEDQARVISSFGNPIFFGSYLVMSIVITLGLALDEARKNERWWILLIAALVGVQLGALWFTGSRGPWIGTLLGLTAFAVLGATTLDRTQLIRGSLTFVAGLLVAVVIVNFPGEPASGGSRGIGAVLAGVNPGGGFGGRADIWEGSIRLLDSWDQQQPESSIASAFRPVFGFGPEMYYYSYPLAANPQDGVTLVSHAHDFPLQEMLELGIAGFTSFVALAVAVLVAGLGFIRRRRPTADWLTVAMVAVIAALIGRGVEQGVGIARVGDLLPFWALLGVAIAVCRVGRGSEAPVRSNIRSIGSGIDYLRLGAALIVAFAALTIFFSRDVQMVRSGLIAADAFDESATGDRAESIRLFEKAAEISPDVQQFHLWAGELLIEEATAQPEAVTALDLLDEAYGTLAAYEERDPLAFATRLRIGRVLAEQIGRGDNSRRDDLVIRSLDTSNAMRSYPEIQGLMAERVLIAGEVRLGLELSDRAIAMEDATSPQSFAWLTRGDALRGLGDSDGALEAFEMALERETKGVIAAAVHRSMALVYDGRGDGLSAELHRARADEIEALFMLTDAN